MQMQLFTACKQLISLPQSICKAMLALPEPMPTAEAQPNAVCCCAAIGAYLSEEDEGDQSWRC